jgi:hypothetical protein
MCHLKNHRNIVTFFGVTAISGRQALVMQVKEK